MMRKSIQIVTLCASLFLPGMGVAEDLTTLSDLDLEEQIRDAVEAEDPDATLALLTEMKRRGTGLFAGLKPSICEENITLPEGISDWRFSGAARQAYIIAAKAKALNEGSCGCLFAGLTFVDFTSELLGKSPEELVDSDRGSLESFLAEHRRDTEAAYRDHEKSCRAN